MRFVRSDGAGGELRVGKITTELTVNGVLLFCHEGPISPAAYQQLEDAWQDWQEGRTEALCALTGKTAEELKVQISAAAFG